MPASADRNLLFGILALQNDFITRDELVAAINAWLADKSQPMGAILATRGSLKPADVDLLDLLVNRHVEQHGGDAQQSLAALSSVSSVLRRELSIIADDDLQPSLAAVGSAAESTIDQPPESSLRYRVLRPHARGGLGEVFVAEDTEVHRHVALKEMQERYAADPASRGRFLLEAEITGRLEHPGIVPVYGLGVYADGRPYYAMRFIKGDNLGEAIKRFHNQTPATNSEGERRSVSATWTVAGDGQSTSRSRRDARQLAPDFDSLDFRRLLRRFLDVCNAVAYAHSRGVLHRDLKPGNVMLGEFGETLLVDWGLAKVVGRADSSDGDSTIRPSSGSSLIETIAGSAIGTPAFMSPEQAEGKLNELGPATDVYSLGATLYVLLTGRPPVEKAKLADMLEIVRRGEIPPPRAVQPAIPRPLDAVCRKAMTSKPADRYATPQALASDLEHWLADGPVTAFAEPLSIRARRWMRRHPGPVAALTASLLIGSTTLAAGLYFVNAERGRTELARHAEEQQRRAAEERQEETEAVLSFVEDQVFAAARPKDEEGGLGYDVKLADAVQAALPQMAATFSDKPLIEARLRMSLGASFSYLGKPEMAEEQFRGARELRAARLGPDHPDTLRTMQNLAGALAALSRYAEALALFDQTFRLRKAGLGPDHPDTLRSMQGLANSYDALGRHVEALALSEQTLKLRKAKLGPDHPETLKSMSGLADTYDALGRKAEALALREEAMKRSKATLGPDHPSTFRRMYNLAISFDALGRHTEALALYEETLKLQEAKLGSDHPNTLATMTNLAIGYSDLGRHAEALTLHEKALKLQEAKLGPDHPDTLNSHWGVIASLIRLKRPDEALPKIEYVLSLAAQAEAVGKHVRNRLASEMCVLRIGIQKDKRDAAGCRATAGMWESLKRADAKSLYNAACFRAVSAGVMRQTQEAGADEQADQAMAWLAKAVAAGYADCAHMKADTDLAALRDRDDFKKLFADLEAKAAAAKPAEKAAPPRP